MKRSAVEYLWENLKEFNYLYLEKSAVEWFEEAKAIEKQQVAEAWNDGNLLGRNGLIVEEYGSGDQYYDTNYLVKKTEKECK